MTLIFGYDLFFIVACTRNPYRQEDSIFSIRRIEVLFRYLSGGRKRGRYFLPITQNHCQSKAFLISPLPDDALLNIFETKSRKTDPVSSSVSSNIANKTRFSSLVPSIQVTINAFRINGLRICEMK